MKDEDLKLAKVVSAQGESITVCVQWDKQSGRSNSCVNALSAELPLGVLAKLGANYDIIAECRIAIEQARLLCLKAAWMMDQGDARAAAPYISQIKVAAPNMALKVIDEAMQMFGGSGVSQDTPLADMYAGMRTLRFADGPDAVHRMQVARKELKPYTNKKV